MKDSDYALLVISMLSNKRNKKKGSIVTNIKHRVDKALEGYVVKDSDIHAVY